MLKSGFIAGVAVMAVSLPGVAAEKVSALYNFYWKGILVSTAEAEAAIDASTYDLMINFRMRGLAKIFANGRSEVTSRGQLAPSGDIIPRHYNSTGRWDGEDYRRTMSFDAQGQLSTLEQEWPEKWLEKYPREPVPADLQRGPDPASLAVALMKAQLTDVSAAEGVSVQVFDGDSVLEWVLKCAPEAEELEESGKSVFSGPAHACGFDAKLIAGKRILTEKEKKKLEKRRAKEEKRRAKKGEDAEEEAEPVFWLAAQGDAGYLVPVRADFPTDMGRVRMYLKDISIGPQETPGVISSR